MTIKLVLATALCLLPIGQSQLMFSGNDGTTFAPHMGVRARSFFYQSSSWREGSDGHMHSKVHEERKQSYSDGAQQVVRSSQTDCIDKDCDKVQWAESQELPPPSFADMDRVPHFSLRGMGTQQYGVPDVDAATLQDTRGMEEIAYMAVSLSDIINRLVGNAPLTVELVETEATVNMPLELPVEEMNTKAIEEAVETWEAASEEEEEDEGPVQEVEDAEPIEEEEAPELVEMAEAAPEAVEFEAEVQEEPLAAEEIEEVLDIVEEEEEEEEEGEEEEEATEVTFKLRLKKRKS
mmetsp:Transcript_8473/g.19934  ORF Transcript_8473/g.19934 Transcript_8473/m.19934 type:complete len:293 (-) Transcript_8473:281-1159(-)